MESRDKCPWVETPLVWSPTLSKAAGCNIFLKLENLQPSGSFKSRGVGNFMRVNLSGQPRNLPGQESANDHASESPTTHFFCSSGGNAGLGCVHAAVTLGCPATIVVPTSTTDYMIDKLRQAGAKDVIQKGASWAEANSHLVDELLPAAKASGEHAVYVPPFDAQAVWDGNATMVDEIMEQLTRTDRHYPTTTSPPGEISVPDAIICSVGGGGLFSGIMQGLNTHSARAQVVAVETRGADSLSQSVERGELITLPAISSIATSLGARTVCSQAFQYAMDKARVKCTVLDDADAVEGCRRFANDERILVEPACGVCLALCYQGKLKELLPHLVPASRVVIVVCGGSNVSLELMEKYVKAFSKQSNSS